MRIPSGTTDRYVYFVAVDSTDLKTRETGLSSFTVYRSRNGAAAAAMSSPTVNETSSGSMPGVYELLLDEDTTLAAGNDSEEMALHITATGMAPVTRTVEIYRPETTEGSTLAVADVAAILADTNEIQGDLADGGRVDLLVDSIISKVDVVDGIVDNILVDTAEIGAAGAGLTDLGGMSTTMKGQVNTEADTAISDYDPPTKAEMDSAFSTTNGKVDVVDGIVDSILLDTAEIGAAGAGLTDLGGMSATMKAQINTEADLALSDYDPPTKAELDSGLAGLNDISTAQVNAEVDTALADYDAPTKSELDAGFAALNDISTAQVNTEVDTALADIHLDHLLAADYDPASKPGTATALFNELIESDGGVSRFTANALEQGPSGSGGGDATEAKQDQIIAAVITNAAGTDIAADISAVKAETATIVADTNELQTDDVPGLISALNNISTADVNAQCDLSLADYDAPTKAEMDSAFSTTDALISTVDTVVDSILVDTAEIGAAGAGLTELGGMSTAMKAQVNTEADSALSDYDPPTKAELDSAHSTTDALITVVDTVVDSNATKLDTLVADSPGRPAKGVELAGFPFLLVASSDHVTGKTGATVTATRSLDGAAFAACANSPTEVSGGIYKITLASSDLDGDTCVLKFTATDADTRYVTIVTQAT